MVVDPPLVFSFQDPQNEASQGGEAYFTLFNCPLPLKTWGKLLTSKLIKKSATFDKHKLISTPVVRRCLTREKHSISSIFYGLEF